MRSPSNPDPVKLQAYAKINLSLKVIGKRADGYHDIDSVMQSISLHDEIELSPAESVIVECSERTIKDNIAAKAAEAIIGEAKLARGVKITIKKNIPVAAGLAGGSADAAATLIGINKLFGLNLHAHKLAEIGLAIGSDVPFCLVGGTARCTGRGEKIERINPQTGPAFIVVVPRIQVSTKEVYDRFDSVGPGDSVNDLEKAATSGFPRIAAVKETLNKMTGSNWRMSGSGPSLFLELSDISEMERYAPQLEGLKLDHWLVRRADNGVVPA